MSSLQDVCAYKSLVVLNEAKTKKKKVGILALGQYNVCEVRRIWWDDSDDIVELYIPKTKRKWQIGNGSIAMVKVL